MNTLLSIQIIPKMQQGEPTTIVDQAISMIRASGLRYEVGAMETTIEGPFDALLELIKALHPYCIEKGAERLITNIKIDYRPEGVSFEEKLHKYRVISS